MKLFPGRYQRAVGYALLCGVVAHDLWVLPRRPPGDRLADLNVHLGSVRGLLNGASLYDFHAANGAPFTYPPFAGLLFVSLVFVPFIPIGWTAATLVAGYRFCLAVLVVAYARARRLDPMTGFVVVGAAGLAVSSVSWTHHQFVLYLAVGPLLAARQWIAAAAVATIMIVPLDLFVAIGWRDVRVWLAVALVLTLGYPVPPFSWTRDWIAQRQSQVRAP
jgi:hypothetical protein